MQKGDGELISSGASVYYNARSSGGVWTTENSRSTLSCFKLDINPACWKADYILSVQVHGAQ